MTDVGTLRAPGDPGEAGLLVVLALVLVVGLALAHLRLLRAIARAGRPAGRVAGSPAASAVSAASPEPANPADRPSTGSGGGASA